MQILVTNQHPSSNIKILVEDIKILDKKFFCKIRKSHFGKLF